MIDAKECRIGNFVQHESFQNYVQIDGVDLKGLLIELPNETEKPMFHYLKGATPIPLTPEILIAAGFNLHADTDVFENKKMKYYSKEAVLLFFNDTPPANTYLSGFGFTNGRDYFAATFYWIHYVHQIQNLYFALTNTELIINL